MEERKTIFEYLIQTLTIFGITLLVLNVFCRLFGDKAQEISSIFRLGSRGIACETMLQFFTLSALITGIRYVFFTDRFLKRVSVVCRTAGMVCSVIGVTAVFICLFGWFPVLMWQTWCMFLGCFFVCFLVSAGVSCLKERAENRALERALADMQGRDREDGEDEESGRE